jgi:acyl-CoA dehydrogenase
MDLGVSAKLVPLLEEVRGFIEKEILPVEVEFYEDIAVGDRWEWTQRQTDIREGLKTKAKARGYGTSSSLKVSPVLA